MSDSDPFAPKKLALISSKGTLDWAYPPFILATAAGAMGWEVQIFFTFYGLPLLCKDLKASVSPLGNPAMPMKMPFGSDGFQNINWPIPTALMAVPGFNNVATGLMKKQFQNKGVATIEELRDIAVELDVQLIGCQMTMEVFGFDKDQFIEGSTIGGAAMDNEVAIYFTMNGPQLLAKGAPDEIVVPKAGGGGKELRHFIKLALDMDVRLLVCQPSLDLHGYTMDDMIEGVEMIGGAAFNAMATEADAVISF